MPYWSNIVLEKPTFQSNTEKKHNSLVINNVKINYKTNVAVENLFKDKKADMSTLNQPVIITLKKYPLWEKCPNTEFLLVRIFLYSD